MGGSRRAIIMTMPPAITKGMLKSIPSITGIGATNMINIHLKKLVRLL